MKAAGWPLLVTGSGGKLGGVLRKVWPELLDPEVLPLWQVRQGVADVVWPIGTAPYVGPPLAGGVIVHLAGGRGEVSATAALALAVCDLARDQGARHVFLASSSAVYGPDEVVDLTEDMTPGPTSDYGREKLRMEAEVAAWARAAGASAPGITCLRIGNVLGSDTLMRAAMVQSRAGRKVQLTAVAGRKGGPIRSYIGPVSFADVLAQLCRAAVAGQALPQILNLGAAPPVAMADLLDAAGVAWEYDLTHPAPLPRLVLSVERLARLVRLPPDAGLPSVMAAEWRGLRGSLA